MILQSLTHPVGSSYVNGAVCEVENVDAALRDRRQLPTPVSMQKFAGL